ncbi:MAG: hypothetical protein ACI85I_001454 [Arenicella sp.]|jgi:hypothetical protein
MNKVFRKLFTVLAIGSATTFMVGCDDDEGIDVAAESAKNLAISQTTVEAKVTSDNGATGTTDADAWKGWTAAANLGYFGSTLGVIITKPLKVPTKDISTNISVNTTWKKDTVYILRERVSVLNGVTLTIEAGTVIKGDETKKNEKAATLMVAQGGKLNAIGTAEEPIVFTSTADTIEPYQVRFASPNLKVTDQGKWGGLVILGKAPISVSSANGTERIEGVGDDEDNGIYGGTDAADNSGTIQYVSIRHGGAEIAAGKEINGLTLGGVGSGTTIDHIEVLATSDDGVEFFGGTVNVTNILVVNQGDDGIDIDQSYSGTVDNFMVIMGIATSDEGLEIDGREGDLEGKFTLKNGMIKIDGSASAHSADFKSKATGTVQNVIFQGFATTSNQNKLKFRFDSESQTGAEKEDAAKNVANGDLVITETKFEGGVLVYSND